MLPNERFEYLFRQFAAKISTEEEKQELMESIDNGLYDEQLRDLVGNQWTGVIPDVSRENEAERIAEVYHRIMERVKVKHMRSWKRYVAVAAAVLVFLAGGYWLMLRNPGNKAAVSRVTADIQAPKASKAVITLSNNTQIILDSAANGTLAREGNVKLVKLADGQVVYTPENATGGPAEYNTLYNPRGSRVINLTLSDGSKVWLNAESSVTYPTAFAGSERKVSITGEAYFEVTHHPEQPFIVSKGSMGVTVLGTHFNVNAYDNEPGMQITLLEGSVKVSNGAASLTLKPGQQAKTDNGLQLVTGVNLDMVTAWKNGNFYFSHTDLGSVMRQVSRWYDVDVSYEDKVPEMYFGGEVSKDNDASQVLKMLAESNVHFRIEGKKITIMK